MIDSIRVYLHAMTLLAPVVDITVKAKYQFSKNVGFTLGITYFNAEVTVDEPDFKAEVDYGIDGVALGIDLRF